MRARGFDTVQLALVVVLVGMLSGAVLATRAYINGVDKRGFERGRDTERLAAAELERTRWAAVGKRLLVEEKLWLAAEDKARDYEQRWKENLRETRRTGKPLASCVPAQVAASAGDRGAAVAGEPARPDPGAPGVADPAAADLVLHWLFVGMYDSAFVGVDGQPVFRASSQYALAPERAGTPSPYGLGELLEVHGENARALSACLRAFDEAMSKLDAAAAAWDAR